MDRTAGAYRKLNKLPLSDHDLEVVNRPGLRGQKNRILHLHGLMDGTDVLMATPRQCWSSTRPGI